MEQIYEEIFIILGMILVVFLLARTFFDFQIATAAFRKDNLFSYFFEQLAPVIYATLLQLSVALIFWASVYLRKKQTIRLVVASIVYVVFTILGILLAYSYIKLWDIVYGGIAALVLPGKWLLVKLLCILEWRSDSYDSFMSNVYCGRFETYLGKS